MTCSRAVRSGVVTEMATPLRFPGVLERGRVRRPKPVILRHVTVLGYTVSVFRFPSSLLGRRPAAVEMHAIDLRTDPPEQHVARVVVGEAGDIERRCAELLAGMVTP